MGNRLSKIYTRTGDEGETGLGDGSRVSKDNTLVEAMGAVDELNCHLGQLRALLDADDELQDLLHRVQNTLFDLGGELSIPGLQLLQQPQVLHLEQTLDHWNAQLPPLKNFILPGGSATAASCHLARAVCRRAERRLVTHAVSGSVNAAARCYLNRLSDLLFVLARVLARRAGAGEVLWEQTSQ